MDPRWWLRLGLAAIVIAFIVAIARMSMMAFSPEAAKLDRSESAATGRAPPRR